MMIKRKITTCFWINNQKTWKSIGNWGLFCYLSPCCHCSALHIGLFPPYEMLLQDDTNKPRNASRTGEDPAVTGRWRCTRGDRGDYWGFQRGRGLLDAAERSESEAPSQLSMRAGETRRWVSSLGAMDMPCRHSLSCLQKIRFDALCCYEYNKRWDDWSREDVEYES